MVITTLGSGSSGNCYILKASNGQMLILEAGLPLKEILKGLDFNTKDVVGCAVSHCHFDHALSVNELVWRGIKVYTLPDVIERNNLLLGTPIQHKHRYHVGDFKILVLNMAHDVPCVGFVIEHPEMGKMLFATDTHIVPYRIPGLNHIWIEANYRDEDLYDAIEKGSTPHGMKERLMTSHMELSTALEWLKSNNLSDVRDITLLHLSKNNSNPAVFKSEVEKVTGIPTYIAEKGLEVDLSLEQF